MPTQKVKSGLMAKYGKKLDAAVREHAGDETEYGFVRLPPGIINGVARLSRCYFDVVGKGKQNAGEYYFRAEGVVIEPEYVLYKGQQVKVAGLQTSIFEMCCDTTNRSKEVTTQEEHIDNILNEFRKLGGPEFTEGATGADLEDLAAQLEEDQPYFRFSTSEGQKSERYPEPKIFENWHGANGLEDYQEPDRASGAVEDEIEEGDGEAPARGAKAPASSNGRGKTPGRAAAAPRVKTGKPAEAEEEEETEEEEQEEEAGGEGGEEEDEGTDLTALAEEADGGDRKAQAELTRLAHEAGITKKEVQGADDWASVAAEIESRQEAGGEEEGEGEEGEEEETGEDEPVVPEAEEVWTYKPLDQKTKKRVKRGTDYEVVTVNTKKKTVTLRSLTDNEMLTGRDGKPIAVPFDDLEPSR